MEANSRRHYRYSIIIFPPLILQFYVHKNFLSSLVRQQKTAQPQRKIASHRDHKEISWKRKLRGKFSLNPCVQQIHCFRTANLPFI